MSPQGPRKMTMKVRLIYEHSRPDGEAAINAAVAELEKDGYAITQVMNVTSTEALDDQWKMLIFGAKEQEDPIIQPVKTVVVNSGLPPRDRN